MCTKRSPSAELQSLLSSPSHHSHHPFPTKKFGRRPWCKATKPLSNSAPCHPGVDMGVRVSQRPPNALFLSTPHPSAAGLEPTNRTSPLTGQERPPEAPTRNLRALSLHAPPPPRPAGRAAPRNQSPGGAGLAGRVRPSRRGSAASAPTLIRLLRPRTLQK